MERRRERRRNGCEFTELDFGLPLKTGPILLIFFFWGANIKMKVLHLWILFQRNITH